MIIHIPSRSWSDPAPGRTFFICMATRHLSKVALVATEKQFLKSVKVILKPQNISVSQVYVILVLHIKQLFLRYPCIRLYTKRILKNAKSNYTYCYLLVGAIHASSSFPGLIGCLMLPEGSREALGTRMFMHARIVFKLRKNN
jgi:hypothetical protein